MEAEKEVDNKQHEALIDDSFDKANLMFDVDEMCGYCGHFNCFEDKTKNALTKKSLFTLGIIMVFIFFPIGLFILFMTSLRGEVIKEKVCKHCERTSYHIDLHSPEGKIQYKRFMQMQREQKKKLKKGE